MKLHDVSVSVFERLTSSVGVQFWGFARMNLVHPVLFSIMLVDEDVHRDRPVYSCSAKRFGLPAHVWREGSCELEGAGAGAGGKRDDIVNDKK